MNRRWTPVQKEGYTRRVETSDKTRTKKVNDDTIQQKVSRKKGGNSMSIKIRVYGSSVTKKNGAGAPISY